MSIKRGPRRKSSLSSYFWFHHIFHPVCQLRKPGPSIGRSMTAHSLTQVRCAISLLDHNNVKCGVVAQCPRPVWHLYSSSLMKILMQLVFLQMCTTHNMLLWSKLCKEPDVYFSLYLTDNSWCLNDLSGISLSLSLEFCLGKGKVGTCTTVVCFFPLGFFFRLNLNKLI